MFFDVIVRHFASFVMLDDSIIRFLMQIINDKIIKNRYSFRIKIDNLLEIII